MYVTPCGRLVQLKLKYHAEIAALFAIGTVHKQRKGCQNILHQEVLSSVPTLFLSHVHFLSFFLAFVVFVLFSKINKPFSAPQPPAKWKPHHTPATRAWLHFVPVKRNEGICAVTGIGTT
jgi:hypothetical protein